MTPDRPSPESDLQAGLADLEGCWSALVGPIEDEVDLQNRGVSSLDLLGLELEIRRRTNRAVSLDGIEGPITFSSVRAAVENAAMLPVETDPDQRGVIDAPATAAQSSQWLAERLRPWNRGYLVPLVVELPEATSWKDLSGALTNLVKRHPALRTRIVAVEDDPGSLRQMVGPVPGMVVIEPRSVPDVEDGSIALVIKGMKGSLPSVSSGRPWRAIGLMVDGRLQSLLLLLHHVAVDDPSLRMLVRDLHQELKRSFQPDSMRGDRSRKEADQRDLVLRETRASASDEEIDWWGRRLGDVPPRLDLRPVHDVDTLVRRRSAFLDLPAVRRLDARVREAGGVRTAAVLRAARSAAAQIGLASDGPMAIGVPMSIRDHLDHGTVGMFLNTLPISIAANDSLSNIAGTIRKGRRHRNVAYESIVRSADPIDPIPGRAPWLDFVVGVVESDHEPTSPLGWRVASPGHTPFPIMLIVRFESEGCRIELDVDPAWLCDDDADQLLALMVEELESNSKTAVGDLGSVCEGSSMDTDGGGALPEIVRAAAREAPDAAAVRDAGGEWSFQEFDDLGDRLASSILARVSTEFKPGSPIAIFGRPSRETSLAVLAAMRAGGAAMPIPPEAPVSRVADLLRRSEPIAAIVTSADLLRIAAESIAASGTSVPVVAVDEESLTGDCIDLPRIDADQACYVLFTSGSTGEPKAVRMHHGGLAGLIDHERRRTPLDVAARTAQYAPLGFDVAFQELFSTWASRGTVVSVPLEVRRDPSALSRFVRNEGITRLHLPPLVLRALAAGCQNGFPECLREIICAGDALRIDEIVRVAAGSMSDSVRIVNQYGPTETHVVTHLDLGTEAAMWPARPSIGAPIDGVRIQIEDQRGVPVGVGESGELVVHGAAVALGYLDGSSGGFEVDGKERRRYRTGDEARLNRRGQIEFLGRSDRQMKISGYRVEPGEIEAALVELEQVQDAAVISVPRGDESKSTDSMGLQAFVTGPSGTAELADCLRQIRDRLPPWMIPDQIQAIEALPRSSNGKVDHALLRQSASLLPIERRGNGWTVSDVLAHLAEETDPEAVSETTGSRSLARLGIDSLGAIRLQIALHRRHGIELPVARILGMGLQELRQMLDSSAEPAAVASGSDAPAALREEEDSDRKDSAVDWHPLDPLVRDVLAEEALAPEGAFHLAWTIRFPRRVPIEDIGQRLALVRRRHPTLRTARRAEFGERVIPVAESVPFDLESFEEPPSEEMLARILRHPLRISEGLPWRMATWIEPSGTTSLLVVIHHAAVDGRTAQKILEEIVNGRSDGASVLRSSSKNVDRDVDDEWWIDRLRSVLGKVRLPNGDFDGDGSREVAIDHRGGSVFRRTAAIAAEWGMAPIVPALVAWAIVLGRSSGRDKVVIGIPFATDLDELGLGASVLPVAIAIDDERSLESTLREVAATIGEGLDHRNGALGRIVRGLEPDSSFVRPPLDGVLTRDDVARHFQGAAIRWTSTGAGVFRASLVVPAEDEDAPVAADVETSLLDGEPMTAFLNRVTLTLERICTEMEGSENHQSGVLVGEIDGLDPLDQKRIEVFSRGDDHRIRSLAPLNLVEEFRRQVERDPDAPAVIDRDGTISYRELDLWSGSIALKIRSKIGDPRGRAIAVAGPRSAATIAGMLATARVGGWFVPIDDDAPADRRAAQITASRPIAALVVGGDGSAVPGISLVIDPLVCRGGPADLNDAEIDPDSPLYAMFTSGTTGEPRGAVIPHRAVVRLVEDPWFLPAGSGFRMLHAAPLAFDASTLEIWWPLLNGGTVCCWEGSGADLGGLHARMRRDGVQGCWLTAAIFHLAVDAMPEFFQNLDVVLTGGDVVSADHVRRLLERRPQIALINGYGPTENTVFTACESLVAGGVGRESIPVGRPIRGTRVRIVDRSGRDVSPGRFGELLATGTGVGLGYLGPDGQPEIRDGFESSAGAIQYRTGDRVRWRVDGRIEFGGRLDAQVKVAGRRIELGAIETSIRSLTGVRDACATSLEEDDRKRLASIVVLEPESGLDPAGIRSELAGRLPEWEVPGVIRVVSMIPTTQNGKPDRRRVAKMLQEATSKDRSVAVERASLLKPRGSELIGLVQSAIAEIASVSSVEPEQSIREIGLDSLDLLRLAIELESRVARPVAMVDVMEGGSAMAIASRIAAEIDREDADLVNLQVGSSPHGRGLYCIPGVGGTVFSFQSIVDGLPEWLPIHGLPYPGTAGRADPLRRIPAMGRVFADRIKAANGQAAVLLGYSLGGFVAFEAARILSASGPPPKVVVIDSAPLGLSARRSLASRVMNPRDWKMRFQNVLPAGILDRIGSGARGRTLQSLRGVVAAGFDAMRHYDPEPAPVDVVVLRTTETDFGPVGGFADLGWGALARSVEVQEIQTSHLECFRGGSMDLARVVRSIVERSTESG